MSNSSDGRSGASVSVPSLSVALVAVTFCVLVGLCPVSGWNVVAMVVVSLIAIGGILHVAKEDGNGRAGREKE